MHQASTRAKPPPYNIKAFLAWLFSVFLCSAILVAVLVRGDLLPGSSSPVKRASLDIEPSFPAEPTKGKSTTRFCTGGQAAKQGRRIDAANIRGCPADDDMWMRMFHMLVPGATVVVDVGSNKGYTAARMFELWNPEIGLDAKALFQSLKAVTEEADMLECGACMDCAEMSVPLVSIPLRICAAHTSRATNYFPDFDAVLARNVEAFCQDRKHKMKPLQVYSFDGYPTMINTVTKARDHFVSSPLAKTIDGVKGIPANRLREDAKGMLKNSWRLELAAFSSTFTPGATVEFIIGKGETGHVVTAHAPSDFFFGPQKIIVPLLTVDELVRREHLSEITILKVDTEGHDPNVLRGAKKTLKDHVATLVIFEYHDLWDKRESLIGVVEELFEGYACYFEGQNSLAKITQNCWSKELEFRRWSNVWCLSLKSADGRAVASAFDKYSLAFL